MSDETNTSRMSDNIWNQAYLNDWMGWWKQMNGCSGRPITVVNSRYVSLGWERCMQEFKNMDCSWVLLRKSAPQVFMRLSLSLIVYTVCLWFASPKNVIFSRAGLCLCSSMCFPAPE